MSTKLNVEMFVDVLKKSGLVDGERLDGLLGENATDDGRGDDPLPLAIRLTDTNLLTKWQAEKLLQGKYRGFFLGKYKLLSLLGKGGMSSVYLAEHLVMRRRCALKVLPGKYVDDSSYLARFHREAQAIALLNHPNIVRAYDVDSQYDGDRQIHFLVMEHVEGPSLYEMVREQGPASFLNAAEYARQTANGLRHAHDCGMVHRDIKPGNLLVDPQGVVKILDLGLARFCNVDEGNAALTIRHDEKVLGTADYLAPEQALDSHTVDGRADIYSLGCTLYFLLTGQPPFTDGSLAQRLLAHQIKTPPAVESVRTDTPPSLAMIVRKMMEKRRTDRYTTAAEVENVLFKWIDENADMEWRKAHSAGYGPRTPDVRMIQFTVPVAQPVFTTSAIEVSSDSRNLPIAEPIFPQPNLPEVSLPDQDANHDTALNYLLTLAQPRTQPAFVGTKSNSESGSWVIPSDRPPSSIRSEIIAPLAPKLEPSIAAPVFASNDSARALREKSDLTQNATTSTVLRSPRTRLAKSNRPSLPMLIGIAVMIVLALVIASFSLGLFRETEMIRIGID